MRELALFAGAGGGILGGKLLGWRTVCAVEFDRYARDVLIARQNDGTLAPFPIWDDVRTFDGRAWRGAVDIVSGGFPCQDISAAGSGAGIHGKRSGLWVEMARIVREVRPRFVLVENSPRLVSRGLDKVLGDLAELGFDARWGVLGAADVGAPHLRRRIWIVAADADRVNLWDDEQREPGRRLDVQDRRQAQPCDDGAQESLAGAHSDAYGGRCQKQRFAQHVVEQSAPGREPDGLCQAGRWHGAPSVWWSTEPDVGRVADGVASRVDRLRALGNGQVPAVVRLAWEVLR